MMVHWMSLTNIVYSNNASKICLLPPLISLSQTLLLFLFSSLCINKAFEFALLQNSLFCSVHYSITRSFYSILRFSLPHPSSSTLTTFSLSYPLFPHCLHVRALFLPLCSHPPIHIPPNCVLTQHVDKENISNMLSR